MLATTMLAAAQTMPSQNLVIQTEISESPKKDLGEEIQSNQKANLTKPESFTIFKGKVNYRNEAAVNNAKITFVTASRQFTAYSLKDGSFAMKIPSDSIDDANVIRVSYDDIIKTAKKNPKYDEYGSTEDYILSKAEVNSNYKIVAKLIIMAAGGISISSQNEGSPIVIHQGKEILFSDFEKARQGKKSSCSLENKEYSYFDSEAAIAIYGTKARWGLYILNDKIEK